jgi:hypothetical protein
MMLHRVMDFCTRHGRAPHPSPARPASLARGRHSKSALCAGKPAKLQTLIVDRVTGRCLLRAARLIERPSRVPFRVDHSFIVFVCDCAAKGACEEDVSSAR